MAEKEVEFDVVLRFPNKDSKVTHELAKHLEAAVSGVLKGRGYTVRGAWVHEGGARNEGGGVVGDMWGFLRSGEPSRKPQ